MAQFFNNKKFTASFEDNTNPQLLFVCKAERAHTKMPRVMHRHEHQAEIVFIKEGSGLHTIGEKQYQTIATMVGYNNTNHFHTIFVKMIGMSPGRYRKHWVKERHNDIKGK